MTLHEFGKENRRVVVLIHPSVVMWDYFEYVIPLMEEKYRRRVNKVCEINDKHCVPVK